MKSIEIIEDVTDKYYDMLNSFRADNVIKVSEVKNNEFAFGESYYEMEKRLIKSDDKRLMNDIDLLNELEFYIRHKNIKIIRVKSEE